MSRPSARRLHAEKPLAYFAGAGPREDFLDELPDDATARILEVGCGSGATGARALARGKCGWYAGVEADPRAAAEARTRLSEVVEGDVESVDLPWEEGTFQALVLSEVLEHLVDPWGALRRLHALLARGAVVLASSPNVSHHTVVRMLLRGRWDLADSGLMDRTHLRWFTPATYAEMFEGSGYRVERVGEVTPLRLRARLANALLGARARHLFVGQISIRARRP